MAYNRNRLFEVIETKLPATLKELSKQLEVDRHTIERIIHERTGKSFRGYRKEVLVRSALDLLTQQSGMSCRQIAKTLGYCSPEAFSRFVKVATGSTPSEIRDRQRVPSDKDEIRHNC